MTQMEKLVTQLFKDGQASFNEARAILSAIGLAQKVATEGPLPESEVEELKKRVGSEVWSLWQEWEKEKHKLPVPQCAKS